MAVSPRTSGHALKSVKPACWQALWPIACRSNRVLRNFYNIDCAIMAPHLFTTTTQKSKIKHQEEKEVYQYNIEWTVNSQRRSGSDSNRCALNAHQETSAMATSACRCTCHLKACTSYNNTHNDCVKSKHVQKITKIKCTMYTNF